MTEVKERKPEWLKIKLNTNEEYKGLKKDDAGRKASYRL